MVRRLFSWVLLAAVSGSGALGQAAVTEQSIAAKLQQGPFVMLRGMYAGGSLKFDEQGNLIGRSDLLPFSLSAVAVRNIRLSDTNVEIKGTRLALLFAQGFPADGPETAKLTKMGDVTIRIARDPQHPEDLLSALEKIFAAGFDDALVDDVPIYWRGWLQHQLHPELPAFPVAKDVMKIGLRTSQAGIVTPPRLIQAPDPSFSDYARRAKTNGIVVVGLTVDTSGRARDVCIVRALGMGLDEEAIRAVERYRFSPARMNGTPVPVAINIEVNFRIW